MWRLFSILEKEMTENVAENNFFVVEDASDDDDDGKPSKTNIIYHIRHHLLPIFLSFKWSVWLTVYS